MKTEPPEWADMTETKYCELEYEKPELREAAVEDIQELLNGLEAMCTIDGHETNRLHQGPAKYVLYLVCPGCGYREVELMCAPMAHLVMQAEALGRQHEMDECCGATYLWSELNTWEAL